MKVFSAESFAADELSWQHDVNPQVIDSVITSRLYSLVFIGTQASKKFIMQCMVIMATFIQSTFTISAATNSHPSGRTLGGA